MNLLMGVSGLVIFIVIIYACVRLGVAHGVRDVTTRSRGAAVLRFRIEGRNRYSDEPVTMFLDAADRSAAKEAAYQRGVTADLVELHHAPA